MKFIFQPRTKEDAHQIASWHYLPPYDFYDLDHDPEDFAEFLDPQTWRVPNYSVFNEKNELVGFFDFKQDGQTVEIGLGLRPDLTGKGLGLMFVNEGLAFGQEHFSVELWSLSVATFNARAIRLYERVGFTRLNPFLQHTNGGEYEFLRMVRPA